MPFGINFDPFAAFRKQWEEEQKRLQEVLANLPKPSLPQPPVNPIEVAQNLVNAPAQTQEQIKNPQPLPPPPTPQTSPQPTVSPINPFALGLQLLNEMGGQNAPPEGAQTPQGQRTVGDLLGSILPNFPPQTGGGIQKPEWLEGNIAGALRGEEEDRLHAPDWAVNVGQTLQGDTDPAHVSPGSIHLQNTAKKLGHAAENVLDIPNAFLQALTSLAGGAISPQVNVQLPQTSPTGGQGAGATQVGGFTLSPEIIEWAKQNPDQAQQIAQAYGIDLSQYGLGQSPQFGGQAQPTTQVGGRGGASMALPDQNTQMAVASEIILALINGEALADPQGNIVADFSFLPQTTRQAVGQTLLQAMGEGVPTGATTGGTTRGTTGGMMGMANPPQDLTQTPFAQTFGAMPLPNAVPGATQFQPPLYTGGGTTEPIPNALWQNAPQTALPSFTPPTSAFDEWLALLAPPKEPEPIEWPLSEKEKIDKLLTQTRELPDEEVLRLLGEMGALPEKGEREEEKPLSEEQEVEKFLTENRDLSDEEAMRRLRERFPKKRRELPFGAFEAQYTPKQKRSKAPPVNVQAEIPIELLQFLFGRAP